MTKKLKTRKAPAAKANGAPAAPDPKRAISEIERLVLRHKFLEADQSYRAATAATDKEEDQLLAMHDAELQKIEGKLATLVPDTIHDIHSLLGFAIDYGDGFTIDGAAVDMIKNARLALLPVFSDEVSAEVEKARKKGFTAARDYIGNAFEFHDKLNKRDREEAA